MISCFFFNDTATTEIYTLSLHDALPICVVVQQRVEPDVEDLLGVPRHLDSPPQSRARERDVVQAALRSEEHTSELQSRQYLVCRLLLEKKKTTLTSIPSNTPSPFLYSIT